MSFKDVEKSKAYYKNYHILNKIKNAPRKRANWLKSQYDLTVEGYNKLLVEQDFSCALCKRHMSDFKRHLHVDHCHETNRVRGLLCNRCNTALGSLGDTEEAIENVLSYLTVNASV